jgi:hypothetical protein
VIATVNNRRAVRYQLRDLLREELPEIQVEIGWPGDDAELPSIWLGRMQGTKTGIALGAPRRIYNDEFTIEVVIQTFGPDLEEAETQMDLLTNALEEVHSTRPDLEGVVGLGDSGMAIDIDELEPLPTSAGVVLVCEISVPFFSRIQ